MDRNYQVGPLRAEYFSGSGIAYVVDLQDGKVTDLGNVAHFRVVCDRDDSVELIMTMESINNDLSRIIFGCRIEDVPEYTNINNHIPESGQVESYNITPVADKGKHYRLVFNGTNNAAQHANNEYKRFVLEYHDVVFDRVSHYTLICDEDISQFEIKALAHLDPETKSVGRITFNTRPNE